MNWSSRIKQKDIFCTVSFVQRNFFKHFYFISVYLVLNKLPEYTHFYISKKTNKLPHTLFCLFLKSSKALSVFICKKEVNVVISSGGKSYLGQFLTPNLKLKKFYPFLIFFQLFFLIPQDGYWPSSKVTPLIYFRMTADLFLLTILAKLSMKYLFALAWKETIFCLWKNLLY